ncbi:MAG: hypothetical protein ACTSSH_03865 [Candidatus Heimdallarchaeota archaeon]
MSSTAFTRIMTESDGTKTFKHSQKRRLLELIFLMIFMVIGIATIVIGAIFTNQGLFFRIALIVLGVIIGLSYLESFISIYTQKISIDINGIYLTSYFRSYNASWKTIASIELETRKLRITREEEDKDTRYTTLELILKDDERHVYPLYRFRANEASLIVDEIKNMFQQASGANQQKSGSSVDDSNTEESKPISDEEIDARIAPKVLESELEADKDG